MICWRWHFFVFFFGGIWWYMFMLCSCIIFSVYIYIFNVICLGICSMYINTIYDYICSHFLQQFNRLTFWHHPWNRHITNVLSSRRDPESSTWYTRPGKHTKSYWKWPSRNSGFSHENSMVDLSIVFCKRLPEGISYDVPIILFTIFLHILTHRLINRNRSDGMRCIRLDYIDSIRPN